MDNREVERLSERLERVERDNRRLRRVGAVVVIGFASALLMAQARPNPVVKTVQAEEFIVRDSEGKARIKLGMSDKDPRLTFLDSQGKEVTGLSEGFLSLPSMLMLSNEYGGSLWITGKEGNKINLDVGSNGSAEFTMAGKKLSGEITLTVMPNGKANLSLKDNIAPRASLKLDTDGSPTLVFSDKDLKRRAWLNVRSDGRPELVLADANGGPRAWLMLQPDGGPVVGVQDKQGNIQTMPGEPTEVSAGGGSCQQE